RPADAGLLQQLDGAGVVAGIEGQKPEVLEHTALGPLVAERPRSGEQRLEVILGAWISDPCGHLYGGQVGLADPPVERAPEQLFDRRVEPTGELREDRERRDAVAGLDPREVRRRASGKRDLAQPQAPALAQGATPAPRR